MTAVGHIGYPAKRAKSAMRKQVGPFWQDTINISYIEPTKDTPCILCSHRRATGYFFVSVWEKVHTIIMALQCIPFNPLSQSDVYMHQLSNHHWFRKWLGTWPLPSHYLNQCWRIVNSNLRNKLQSDLKQKSNIYHSRKCI